MFLIHATKCLDNKQHLPSYQPYSCFQCFSCCYCCCRLPLLLLLLWVCLLQYLRVCAVYFPFCLPPCYSCQLAHPFTPQASTNTKLVLALTGTRAPQISHSSRRSTGVIGTRGLFGSFPQCFRSSNSLATMLVARAVAFTT